MLDSKPAGVSRVMSFLSSSSHDSTPTELGHSAQRWSEAATLGERAKMKTTLKELWRGDRSNREIRERNSGFDFRVVRVVRG